jgi:hypothetical protein
VLETFGSLFVLTSEKEPGVKPEALLSCLGPVEARGLGFTRPQRLRAGDSTGSHIQLVGMLPTDAVQQFDDGTDEPAFRHRAEWVERTWK